MVFYIFLDCSLELFFIQHSLRSKDYFDFYNHKLICIDFYFY